MSTIVHQQGKSIDRLTELGLAYELLANAIREGELARASCTKNDPPSTPGFLQWARTTRRLREVLIPLGWKRSQVGKLSTVVAPTGGFAIAVVTGDEATGNPGVTPKTKHPRGPATAAAVEQNLLQLSLFESPAPANDDANEIPDVPERLTWILLISRGADSIRCELSLPGSIGDDGRVESWEERIIVEPVAREPEPAKIAARDDSDASVDFEVSVERKKSSA